MRIQIISDLHVEHGHYILPSNVGDVLIVAGDIASGPIAVAEALRDLRQQAGEGLPIIYVPGNHDWYGADIVRDKDAALASWGDAGITVLQCRSQLLGQSNGGWTVRCIGCTWWASMDWTSNGLEGDEAIAKVSYQSHSMISDFRFIQHNGEYLTPTHVRALHVMETAFLEAEIAAALAVGELPLVVTHNGVAAGSCHPKYGGDLLSAYFINLRPDLTAGVPLWIHGHTHASCDYVEPLTGCRVVCNPKGYGRENDQFQSRLMIDI